MGVGKPTYEVVPDLLNVFPPSEEDSLLHRSEILPSSFLPPTVHPDLLSPDLRPLLSPRLHRGFLCPPPHQAVTFSCAGKLPPSSHCVLILSALCLRTLEPYVKVMVVCVLWVPILAFCIGSAIFLSQVFWGMCTTGGSTQRTYLPGFFIERIGKVLRGIFHTQTSSFVFLWCTPDVLVRCSNRLHCVGRVCYADCNAA